MSDLKIFTALDLEMNQPSGTIIQIGAAVGNIETGEVIETLSVIINPKENLSESIVKLTGITQEQVDSGAELREGYRQLIDLHKKHNSFINPITWGGGDSAELMDQLRKEDPSFDHQWGFGRRWIDAKTVYVSYRLATGQKIQSGLANSLTKVGLSFRGTKHNAKDDAVNTFYMYHELLKIISGRKK